MPALERSRTRSKVNSWSCFRDYRLALLGRLTRQIGEGGADRTQTCIRERILFCKRTPGEMQPHTCSHDSPTYAKTHSSFIYVHFWAFFAGWVSGRSAEGEQMSQSTWTAQSKRQLLSARSASRRSAEEDPAPNDGSYNKVVVET